MSVVLLDGELDQEEFQAEPGEARGLHRPEPCPDHPKRGVGSRLQGQKLARRGKQQIQNVDDV